MTTTILKRSDNFSQSTIDEEIVIMCLDNGTFFSLSGTGRTIWELLDDHADRAGLLTALAKTYGQDEIAIASEFDEFMASISAAGLVSFS